MNLTKTINNYGAIPIEVFVATWLIGGYPNPKPRKATKMSVTFNHKALAQTLGKIHSLDELDDMLNTAASEFDISKFIIAAVPPSSGRKLSEYVLSSNLNPDILDEYDKLELLQCSPHFEALRNSEQPRIWQTDMVDEYVAAETTDNMKKTSEFLYKNDISMGCSFPIHSKLGLDGVVMFMGDRGAIDDLSISYLQSLSSFAYDFICDLNTGNHRTPNTLTKRECEILTWVADGKTSNEVGLILSVSTHTINTHLHTATRKMDCVNRTQLVAKAIRLGIIS